MKKIKLIERRKAKGFSQSKIAEKLCMDVSNYNRREGGQVKISLREWEKLADILQEPIENIYEIDDTPSFIFRGSSVVYYHNYSLLENLMETQRKYIEELENVIHELSEKDAIVRAHMKKLKNITSH
jgi:transcriptional regulator with XRE-family HTH domain